MFRRIEQTLEPDSSFPADLNQLGFFINRLGQICMIEAPEKYYLYRCTNNERVNEVYREAMQTCQRKEIEARLVALGLRHIHLPSFSIIKPNAPHVPILSPSPELLKKRKRIIVLIAGATQDLGVLAYRQLQRELGINGGSVINFAKELIKRSDVNNTADQDNAIFKDKYKLEDEDRTPALVALNTGQLLYSHKHNQAMTLRSWSAMPRNSIAHPMVRIDDEENRVPGHRNAKEHITSVFNEVIFNSQRVSSDAEIYVIAIEDGAENFLSLLAADFDRYGSRLTAMALVESLVDDSQITNPRLSTFLRTRTRHWKYSDITNSPLDCIQLPDRYDQSIGQNESESGLTFMKSTNHICWYDNVSGTDVESETTGRFQDLKADANPPLVQGGSPPGVDPLHWSSGQAALCPTFAGGDVAVAECTFTDPLVQKAVISFFEEVSQDPRHYCNPPLALYTAAPKPTAENPFTLSTDDCLSAPALDNQIMPEQLALKDARLELSQLRNALAASMPDMPALKPGRKRLLQKIHAQERLVKELETKAREAKTFSDDEMPRHCENWRPQAQGSMVQVAGTMVDSELLKAAGLMEGSEGETGRDGHEDEEDEEEEKAFL